jgi:ribosomal protein L16 Arg81 hydroxylase
MRVVTGDENVATYLDVTLEPGDFLLVPAGYRHRCANAAERSLHASIFFWPMTSTRALDLLFRQMVECESDRAPLRHDATTAAAAAAEAQLKQVLIDRIQALSLADLRARHGKTDHSPAGRAAAG